jgi:NitT/TauT family transport system substrate-binding protein
MEQTPTAGHRPLSRRGFLGLTAAATLGVGLTSGCGNRATAGVEGGVSVLAFQPPSLGAFLPAIITAQGIDRDHSLPVTFSFTTPDNYNTEFFAGHHDVGGSAALLSEALRTERQVDVTYMFNLFDYFTAVVTSEPEIHGLGDLRGKRLAAATGTTNHAMFEWFARRNGLDLNDVELMNQTPAGLSTMALTGKTDATEIWEPAYTSLQARKRDIRTIDIGLDAWQSEFSTNHIPYLGLAARSEWASAHPEQAKTLYAIYRDAAAYTTSNPADAAAVIAAASPNGNAKTLQKLIEDPTRLKLHVAPAAELVDDIAAVFKAGLSTGYLEQTPPESIIYKGLA